MITEENPSVPGFADQHYSVSQVARMWGLSDDAVRRIFEKEPDVLILVGKRGKIRRSYRTMRIPAYVVERVHKRLAASQEKPDADNAH
jgi:hypothetical protein